MILQADARCIPLADRSVHCVVTSPPYWNLRDYGLPPLVWGGAPDCAHVFGEDLRKGGPAGAQGSTSQMVGRTAYEEGENTTRGASLGAFCRCGAWLGCLGLEPTPDLYVAHIVEVFREIRRVLRNDGTCWLNLGDSYATTGGHSDTACNDRRGAYNIGNRPEHDRRDFRARPSDGLKPKDMVGIPWRVAFALQADGWWLRSDIILSKPNPMPESVTDRPTKSHEYLFLLAKSKQYYYDAEAIKEPAINAGRVVSYDGTQKTTGHENRTYPGVTPRDIEVKNSRNRRTVWEIATQPFSANALCCGTAYIASPDCRAHGLRAFPESWRRAADGEPQELAGGYRIDSSDARLALAPVVVSASSSCHTPDARPNSEPRTPESTAGSRMPVPSLAADSPVADGASLSRTTRTRSSRGPSPDSSDLLALDGAPIATTHSMGTRRMVGPSGSSDTAAEGTLFRIEDIARLGVQFERDGSGSRAALRISDRTSYKCSCKAIIHDHFATFAEALVEPCVLAGTSEAGCCGSCGAPWERITEDRRSDATNNVSASRRDQIGKDRTAIYPVRYEVQCFTTGWEPTCDCQDSPMAKPLVLDPFAGSGTVGEVCHRLGRRFVGLELKADYCRLAYARTAQLGLL